MSTLRRHLRELDYTLILVLILLAVYSCIAILAATYGKTAVNMPSHPVLKQALYEVVGFVAMFALAFYDYRNLRRFHWWIYGVSIVLLVVVFARPAIQGAHSWIGAGPVSIQPSEFAKLALILSTSSYLASLDESEFPDDRLRRLWPVLALFVPPFLLTLKEPALGQALVMFAITGTLYTAFARRSHFVVVVVAIVVMAGLITVVATQFPDQAQVFINQVLVKHKLLKPYQADRIVTWLDPGYDPLGAGFNVHQAQIAVGSGGVFGEGLLNGIETRGGWVPNQWNDYIFTAIAEEFGFVGASALIFLFLILFYRLASLARSAQDALGTYLILGTLGMFAFQVFENIGMDMYLSPSTGITLPFISYGGSSLVANYMAIGVALSVGLRRKKLRFS
ncbi:MAG: rod shape-determining protein RodA [Alicyclobacillus sp.]|nr:rod shape-determining protein RodA [Alicyclobacillus sp.]